MSSTPKRVGLGRGLGALLPPEPSATQDAAREIAIEKIIPNPHQPRTNFLREELEDLANSIKEHGVIQPLIVSEEENKYVLIAGERRLRAAQIAGLESVPVIIRHVTDQEMLEIALIENVQREDLSPLETAEAYRSLEENFNLTHEEIAKRVGKNRVSITNTLRLLKLPEQVRFALANRTVSEGHARVLLSLPTMQAQNSALLTIVQQGLNVRQTEALVRNLLGFRTEKEGLLATPHLFSAELRSVEEKLMQTIGTKVSIHPGKKGGTIQIHYFSDEDLNNVIEFLSNQNNQHPE